MLLAWKRWKNYLNIALSGGDLAGCWRNREEGHARLNILPGQARSTLRWIHISMIWWYDDIIIWWYDDMMNSTRTSKTQPLLDSYFQNKKSVLNIWYANHHVSPIHGPGRMVFCVFCWGCFKILWGLNYQEVKLLWNGQITQPWWAVGKGPNPYQNGWIFRKSSKRPLKPSPHFRTIMLRIFSEIHE